MIIRGIIFAAPSFRYYNINLFIQWSTCMPKDLSVLSWHWQRQANSSEGDLPFQWTEYMCSW